MEGVLRRTIAGLEQDQPVRRAMAPEDAEKIDSFIKRIEDLLNLNQPFHIVSLVQYFFSALTSNVLVFHPVIQ